MKGLVLAAIGYSIWGVSQTLTRIGLESASPAVLLTARFLVAFVLMNILLASGMAKLSLRGKKIGRLFLLGLLEPILAFLFESYGIYFTNASFAGIMVSTGPIISFFIAAALLKERPTRRQKIFIWLPVAGVAMTALSGHMNGIIRPVGVVLLIASCCAAAFARVVNRGVSAEFTAFERTYVMMALGCAVFGSMAVLQHGAHPEALLRPLQTPGFLFAAITLGVFCSLLAYLSVNAAAAELPVTQISVFPSLTTVVSIMAGTLVLGEPLTAGAIVGAALIMVGIWNVTR